MDDKKDFQKTIFPLKFEHDDICHYSKNNNVYNFENQKKIIFEPEKKIKCEKKCFDIVNKWITRVIIEAPTGNNINNIITREIMMLKVKYPFLPIQQLQGKALVKFKIPNLMGNVVRSATAKKKITEDIDNKFSSLKTAKESIFVKTKICKDIVSFNTSETLDIDKMCDNLITTPRKNRTDRKRKVFPLITNTNSYINESFSGKKGKFDIKQENSLSSKVRLNNINKIDSNYIQTSKINVEKKIKTFVECSPMTQNYSSFKLSNQFGQMKFIHNNITNNNNNNSNKKESNNVSNRNNGVCMELSRKNISFEQNLSGENIHNINDKVKKNNDSQPHTYTFCQKIKTYAECSQYKFENNNSIDSNHTVDISDRIKYISECSPNTIDMKNNFKNCDKCNTTFDDNRDFQSSLSLEEKKLSLIIKEYNNYEKDNFHSLTFSENSSLFSSISLLSGTCNISISMSSFWSPMSGYSSDYNEKLQLLPGIKFSSSLLYFTQESDSSIPQTKVDVNHNTFYKINEKKKKPIMADCLLLSNVCCEYDGIEKKIACKPKIQYTS